MKTLSAWLMIVVLATVTAGCSTGPGSSGGNPQGDGAPITADEEPDTSDKAIDFKADMQGGDADPTKDPTGEKADLSKTVGGGKALPAGTGK